MSGRRRKMPGVAVAIAAGGFGGYWAGMSSRSQLLGSFPYRGPCASGAQPTIALTFDDGPNEPFTSSLIDILARRAVRGTFFQVGKAVARCPEVSAALAAGGHVIGNHSHSHELHRCFTAPSIHDEVWRSQDVIAGAIGKRPKLYRPPWLARTPATFRVLRDNRMLAVSGTFCHPMEVASVASGRIAARAVARARPGGMLIFHDGYNGGQADRTRTLDAVARTVDLLGERGWEFTTVDRLLDVEAYLGAGEG